MKKIVCSTNSARWDKEVKFSIADVVQFLKELPELSGGALGFGFDANGNLKIIAGDYEYVFIWD